MTCYPSQLPAGDPCSRLHNRTGNSTSGADSNRPFFHVDNIVSLVSLLICLCGAAGNGAVVWLLGFRLKRSPFSVYILNLACADGTYLLCKSIWFISLFLKICSVANNRLLQTFTVSSYLAGLGLLMAVSTERCVSVLWPLWHRCRRPAHLSCAMCTLFWGLGLCAAVYEGLCGVVAGIRCDGIDWFHELTVVVTFLVLCVSSLTLLVRVQCDSQGPRPGRLYVTVLLTVLAFLLLVLPYNVYFFVCKLSSDLIKIPALWDILDIPFFLNGAVNPVIYYFVGRYRQRKGGTPLREVLQRALQGEEEGTELGGTRVTTYTTMFPEPRGYGCLGSPQV